MSSAIYRVRRATLDDLSGLLILWSAMDFPLDELERRLTEFQLVETIDGSLVGAIGLQVIGPHAHLHSEAFLDFAHADVLRGLLWERIQTLAKSLSLTRIWTTETAPYWRHEAFHPATAQNLMKLPPTWNSQPEDWLTLELRDEELLRASLETAFTQLKQEHIHESQSVLHQARLWKYLSVTLAIVVAGVGIVFCIYLLRHYPNLLHR